jgi:hypothetical protein
MSNGSSGSLSAVAQNMSVGSAQSFDYPWPQTWYYPTHVYPTYTVADDYANEIEVTRHEHDVTLTFYRRRGSSSPTLIKSITVPLALLDSIST